MIARFIGRGGRVAEGAPLLRVYGLIAHRGFESLPLRHTASQFLQAPPVPLYLFEKYNLIFNLC